MSKKESKEMWKLGSEKKKFIFSVENKQMTKKCAAKTTFNRNEFSKSIWTSKLTTHGKIGHSFNTTDDLNHRI